MAGVGEKIMVSAFTGVMRPVLGKLTQMIEKEYVKIKSVRKKVESLKRELVTINVALEKYEAMKSPDEQVKAWMKEVREIAHNIEDCIDLFMYHVDLELPDKGGGGAKKLIRKTIKKLRKLGYRHRFAQEIQELKCFADEAYERHKKYEIDGCGSSVTHTEVDPRLPALYVEVENLVGIDGPSNEIIDQFIDKESVPAKRRGVVCIVGSGGAGKTTLANQVYKRARGRFSCSGFVSVSEKPNMVNILSDLLVGIGDKGTRSDNLQHIIDRLRAYLENARFTQDTYLHNRYLIVIDDIWSESAWKFIQCALPRNVHGSRIIMTTRNLSVAAEFCFTSDEGFVYPMKALSRIDSEILFVKRTFMIADKCPDHLLGIMSEILDKCDGLPLPIVNIATLLANKQGRQEEWERVRDSIGSVHGKEKEKELEMMDTILALSYNDLPHHLKTCLLYFSMYPEYRSISKHMLVWRWIAEGFVVPKHGYTLEEVGESYFNELINRSMIKPEGISYDGKAIACQVHDIVHDFIVSRSTEENFLSTLGYQDTPSQNEKIRRLCVQNKYKHVGEMSQQTMDLSHLRSFHLSGCVAWMPPLMDLRILRVLYLEDSEDLKDHHLQNIGSLIHLRYLGLRRTGIENLPVQIRKLEFLQTLDVRGTKIRELPESIIHLKQLRRLIGDALILPDGFGNMEALQELWCISGCKSSVNFGKDLQNLLQLRVLHLGETFWHADLDDQTSRKEGLLSALCKLGENNLRSLYLFSPRDGLECFMNSWRTPARFLQDFVFKYGIFSRFPKWINPSLRDLTYLHFGVDRMQGTDLHMLQALPALSVLYLSAREIPEEGFLVSCDGFQRLTFLHFGNVCGPGLRFEQGAMPKLKDLQLEFHPDKARAAFGAEGFGIQHLSSLCHIRVHINNQNEHSPAVKYAKCHISYGVKLLPNKPELHIYSGNYY